MRYYIYKVKDDSGRILHAIAQGGTERDIKAKVGKTKYFFISAKVVNKKSIFQRKVKAQTLIMFTHRLTSLVEAGVPILQAMDILWRQTEDMSIQLVASHMKSRLEEGSKISDSMGDFPNMFSTLYRSLIRVGELSGVLIAVLRKLSEYLDYRQKLIEKTKKATLYPLIVVCFSIVVLIGMFAFVVPIFEKLLIRLRVELPAITRFVLAVSNAMRNPITVVLFILLFLTGVVIFVQLKRNKRFAFHWDKLKLKIPYFGRLLYTLCLSTMFRSLSILLGSGVPIIESMEVAASTAGNRKVVADMGKVQEHIEHGASLYDAFKESPEFPVMLKEMIGVGESSGMLVPVLEKLTTHFDEEVDYELNRFLTFLEPALIVMVGGIVVLVLLSIYTPIVSIWQGIMK